MGSEVSLMSAGLETRGCSCDELYDSAVVAVSLESGSKSALPSRETETCPSRVYDIGAGEYAMRRMPPAAH